MLDWMGMNGLKKQGVVIGLKVKVCVAVFVEQRKLNLLPNSLPNVLLVYPPTETHQYLEDHLEGHFVDYFVDT